MGHSEFLAADRAYERRGEVQDEYDSALHVAHDRHAAAIRKNILLGHAQTLHDLGNAFGDLLSEKGIAELLIRTNEMCGPLAAGQMVADLIAKAVKADADTEAEKEVERTIASRKERDADSKRMNRVYDIAMTRQVWGA